MANLKPWKFKVWALAGILVFLGGGGIVALSLAARAHPEKPAGPRLEEPARDKVQVKVVNPRKGVLERLCIQPGSVHSFESVRLFAMVPGFLKFQDVDIGDHVKKGALLAIVDVPDIEARVEHATASVEKAHAELLQMNSHVDVAVADYEASVAEVAQAEAMARAATAWVKYRKIQLGRMEQLVKNNSIEERLYDESKERHDASVESEIAAKVKIATTQANVKAMKAKIEQARADVVEAQARIKLANADLKKAQVDLNFASITAPFEGDITLRGMNPGDFVRAANGGANIEPLFTLDRTDLFRVVVLVPDRDVQYVKVGRAATLEIDSLPGQKFTAKVSRLAKRLDPQTRLMRVELDLPNPTGQIYHGMYGQVTIVLEKGENVLSIPNACLAGKAENRKAKVYVLRDGRAKLVQVDLGLDTGLRVAVVNGLTRDDQVILNPGDELAESPEVNATPGDDSATLPAGKK